VWPLAVAGSTGGGRCSCAAHASCPLRPPTTVTHADTRAHSKQRTHSKRRTQHNRTPHGLCEGGVERVRARPRRLKRGAHAGAQPVAREFYQPRRHERDDLYGKARADAHRHADGPPQQARCERRDREVVQHDHAQHAKAGVVARVSVAGGVCAVRACVCV
jgi:hypothetical protein